MNFADGTQSVYISEQVSHHPPVSAFYFASTENNLIIQGGNFVLWSEVSLFIQIRLTVGCEQI